MKVLTSSKKHCRALVVTDEHFCSLTVIRGGSWHCDAASCRSAARDGYAPINTLANVGFRPVFSSAAAAE